MGDFNTQAHPHTHAYTLPVDIQTLSNTLLRINLYEGKPVLQWTGEDCYYWALNEVSRFHGQPDTQLDNINFTRYRGCDLVRFSSADFIHNLSRTYGRELHQAFQALLRSNGLNVHTTTTTTTPTTTSTTFQNEYDLEIPGLENLPGFDETLFFDDRLIPLGNIEGLDGEEEATGGRLTDISNLPTLAYSQQDQYQELIGAVGGEGEGGVTEEYQYHSLTPPDHPHPSSSSPQPQSSYTTPGMDGGYWPQGEAAQYDYNISSITSPYPSTYSSPSYLSTPSPPYDDEDQSSTEYTPTNDDSWDDYFQDMSVQAVSLPPATPPVQDASVRARTPTRRRGTQAHSGTQAHEHSGPLAQLNTSSRRRSRGPKNWEFIARLLADPKTNPSLVQWVDEGRHTFKFNKPQTIAAMWGRRSNKESLTYDNFARGLRYHYKTGALKPVQERQLVYQCGSQMIRFIQELSR